MGSQLSIEGGEIMDKIKLEMDFLDVVNKRVRISLDDPKEDLTNTDIEEAMESIISNNVFLSKDGDLVAIEAARIITTSTNEITF